MLYNAKHKPKKLQTPAIIHAGGVFTQSKKSQPADQAIDKIRKQKTPNDKLKFRDLGASLCNTDL